MIICVDCCRHSLLRAMSLFWHQSNALQSGDGAAEGHAAGCSGLRSCRRPQSHLTCAHQSQLTNSQQCEQSASSQLRHVSQENAILRATLDVQSSHIAVAPASHAALPDNERDKLRARVAELEAQVGVKALRSSPIPQTRNKCVTHVLLLLG